MMIILGMLYYATSLFDGLNYEKISTTIHNQPETVYTLEVEPSNKAIRIENGFSFGVLYGFESTSLMAEREGAMCAINGMFYEDFGLPMGMIVHDGIPVLSSDIGTPSVVIDQNGNGALMDVHMALTVLHDKEVIEVYGVNNLVPNGRWGLFTPLYGSTTRIRRESTNYFITDNKITEIVRSESPVSVKESDYVLSYVGFDYSYEVGDQVNIDMALITDDGLTLDQTKELMQTGGWLVKDGESVAKDYESFIGYTTAPQPRTLVGIKEDGTMVFAVIDGRDSTYSLGLSGKESAQLMINKGCVDAAYFDGGSSSTMVIEGEVVNKPSGGKERAIAHSILFFVDKEW